MKKKTFPKLIHVQWEEAVSGPPFLIVQEGGVFDVEKAGSRIAVYELKAEGTVQIHKSIIPKGRKRESAGRGKRV